MKIQYERRGGNDNSCIIPTFMKNNLFLKRLSIGALTMACLTQPLLANVISKPATSVSEKSTTQSSKTTSLKNPTIINGITYADATFIKKAFDLKFVDKGTIIREDKLIWLSINTPQSINPRINWRFDGDSTRIAKTVNGKILYPIRYLAEELNSEVAYDSSTNTLTVTNYGVEEIPLTTEKFNTLKGQIIGLDGKPIPNFRVHLFPNNSITYVPALDSIEADGFCDDGHHVPISYTDENGYYEFKNVDTELLPMVSISIQNEAISGVNVSGSIGFEVNSSYISEMKELEENFLQKIGIKGVYSKRTQLPTIYLYPQD